MRKLWGGAFTESTSELVDRFGQTIHSDLNFWQEDIIASVAHARMLGEVGILTKDEAKQLIDGLEKIHEQGPSYLKLDVEDIHTAIETRLYELVGDVAGKLHTARSRNDQVATDTRMYVVNELISLQDDLKNLQGLLLELGEEYQSALMPGYTHQQRAQPITLGFHFLAHFWALQRHGCRAERILTVTNHCPLGSAALAGTSFPIDRQMTSDELGFIAPIPNALDATSDRSYILDALHLCALIMLDLSRVSQELILWSGKEFGFVKLADGVTTGSSIMPQKRNPDMAELVRGKSGRLTGHLVALLTVLKGLPLTYNRDLQEDKECVFDAADTVRASLEVMAHAVASLEVDAAACLYAVSAPELLATDVADALVRAGLPFRRAHQVVGAAVRQAEEAGTRIDRLSRQVWESLAPGMGRVVEEVLEGSPVARLKRALQARGSVAGAPSPSGVQKELKQWKKRVQ